MKVFSHPSRGESIVLKVNQREKPGPDEFREYCEKVLSGKTTVFVRWPSLQEAKYVKCIRCFLGQNFHEVFFVLSRISVIYSDGFRYTWDRAAKKMVETEMDNFDAKSVELGIKALESRLVFYFLLLL